MAEGAGMKRKNTYAEQFPDYDRTPKAVYAALALSLALRLSEDDFPKALELLKDEWAVLYAQGIVPQVPAGGAT